MTPVGAYKGNTVFPQSPRGGGPALGPSNPCHPPRLWEVPLLQTPDLGQLILNEAAWRLLVGARSQSAGSGTEVSSGTRGARSGFPGRKTGEDFRGAVPAVAEEAMAGAVRVCRLCRAAPGGGAAWSEFQWPC